MPTLTCFNQLLDRKTMKIHNRPSIKKRSLFSTGLLALLCFFCFFGAVNAQTLGPWQQVCWGTQWSNYDQVKVVFTGTDCASDWRSNMTVNGSTIASVGAGSCSNGQTIVNGSSGVSLGWVKVGQWHLLVAPWSPRFNYSCNVTYEDTGLPPLEGNFTFYVANYIRPSLSVTKAATPTVFAAGASGQSYTITVNVANGPTTAPISIRDNLPTGITTSGPITSNRTILSCPGVGSTNLTGCTIPSGTFGPIVVNVPVNVSATASSHNNFNITNSAFAAGGGDPNCSGNGCIGSTVTPILHATDDIDKKFEGLASTSNVSSNDAFPAGSTFTATGGSCSNLSPASPATNTTGVLGYVLPAGNPNCTVTYRLCAPAPNAGVCQTATLTVNQAGPSITVNKVMGSNRNNDADQFTLQIMQSGNAVVSSTTQGIGNSIVAGTGVINAFTTSTGASYSIGEVMATGSSSALNNYNSSLSCTNTTGSTLPAGLNVPFTIGANDTINCTVTNTTKPATLTVRQVVASPIPVNMVPPFSFKYAGTNGWTLQTLTSASLNNFVSGNAQTLSAFNTATTLSVTYPEARWSVFSFSCVDTNAPASGNPTGTLVSATASSVTVPAANVRPGAALRCTALLRHPVP